MSNSIVYIVLCASILALTFAFIFYKQMMKEDEGTDLMKKIAAHVRKGAMAYLKQQYKVVIIVFVVLAILFFVMSLFDLQNGWVWFAFLTGGFFSGLAGFFGMKTATYASARTANAARKSLNSGLKVAFRSGAVMGLVVVGLALLDVSVWFLVLDHFVGAEDHLIVITTTMLTFGMGASTQALFARVGGGIYTKAADVGADLVGKTEYNIPEDDPRNPATIADNVGDNVGDVAGMGADLYESYAGSILATMALGASAFATSAVEGMQYKAVFAPMLIAAVGVLLSIIGIFLVKTNEKAGMKELLGALSRGTNTAAVLIAAATFGIMYFLFGKETGEYANMWWQTSLSVVVGLLAGVIIGKATEYYTSQSYKPTQKVAESSKTGPATVIISGLGLGMLSTAIPVVTVGVAIILAYLCANGFHIEFTAVNLSRGLYGIGIAAVGMLSTLGITLATDAYGPIADNAGGNAEMSGLDPEVRQRTDALDALGNTTAANSLLWSAAVTPSLPSTSPCSREWRVKKRLCRYVRGKPTCGWVPLIPAQDCIMIPSFLPSVAIVLRRLSSPIGIPTRIPSVYPLPSRRKNCRSHIMISTIRTCRTRILFITAAALRRGYMWIRCSSAVMLVPPYSYIHSISCAMRI